MVGGVCVGDCACSERRPEGLRHRAHTGTEAFSTRSAARSPSAPPSRLVPTTSRQAEISRYFPNKESDISREGSMTGLLHRILLALAVLAQIACRPERPGETYMIFIDLTGSVSADQRAAWINEGAKVLARLTFGDAIAIFPITDHTLDAAPLFQDRVESEGQSLEELAVARASRERVRNEAGAALREALATSVRSRSTDLLAVVDKVAQARGEKAEPAPHVFIFSDFLESAAADLMNMEKTRLRVDPTATLIENALRRNNWAADQLQGVTISGVLNAVPGGSPAPLNDRRVLHEFWLALFASVGGQLIWFDTYLQ